MVCDFTFERIVEATPTVSTSSGRLPVVVSRSRVGCSNSSVGPAVEICRRLGMEVEGPLSPDAAFMPHALKRYDGHVTLYHDQGLIPFKMISLHDGVNVTLGTPIIRTSVDHGTAYNIAWQGKADLGSMVGALQLAARLSNKNGQE